MFHLYEYPSWDGKWGPQKGTAALQQTLLLKYDQSFDFGIYNDRPARGGTSPSVHREGRAGDLGFPGSGHPQGYAAVEALLDNAWDLGLQRIIWDRALWDKNWPTGRSYSGVNLHLDHIHYEQTWDAARYHPLTLARADALLNNEEEMTLKQNDRGLTVFDMRAGLSEYFRNPKIMFGAADPQLFDEHLVEWVKAFQVAYGLPATGGEIDGITAVQIRSWVRPRTFPG